MKKILIDDDATPFEGGRALIDLLQTESLNDNARRIVVKNRDGGHGEVVLANGLVLGVTTDEALDEEAMKQILNWEIGEIQVESADPTKAEADSSCCRVDQLLLEIADTIPMLNNSPKLKEEEASSMQTVEEKLGAVLGNLVDRLGGLDGAMLVDNEGFAMASHGSYLGTVDEIEMIGGIATSLLTMTSRVASELHTGRVDRVMIHGEERHIFVSRAGDEMNLVTVAKKDASLGLIFAELKHIGGRLELAMGDS